MCTCRPRTLRRYSGDVGEIQGRYRGDPGEIQGRYGASERTTLSPTPSPTPSQAREAAVYFSYAQLPEGAPPPRVGDELDTSPVSPLHLRCISAISPQVGDEFDFVYEEESRGSRAHASRLRPLARGTVQFEDPNPNPNPSPDPNPSPSPSPNPNPNPSPNQAARCSSRR